MAIPEVVASIPISREVDVRVEFQWDGSSWYNETGNLISINGALETVPPNETYHGGRQVIQQATIVLANKDRRYSARNTSGPLYPYLQNNKIYRKKCRIDFWLDGSWQTVFIGYVKRVPKESPSTNQVTINIWDTGEVSRQKVSTPILRDWHEHEIVAHFLTLAGLSDGVDFVSQTYAAAHGVPATIDYSSSKVAYAWLDDEAVWDELINLATASGSKIYAGRDGRVYYQANWRWSAPYSGGTITASMYKEYDEQIDDKGFYDQVIVGYAPRVPGEQDMELWTLAQNRQIAPGKSEEVEARLRYPAISIVPPTLGGEKGYYLRSLSGEDLSGSCTVSTPQYYGQQVRLKVTNNSNKTVVLGNLKIRGIPLIGQPSEQTRADIGEIRYNRPLEIRENLYLQSKIQADGVKEFLKWWYASLKTVYTLKGLRGDPSRRLMQRITIETPYGNYPAIIIRIGWSIQVGRNRIAYAEDITAIEDVFASDSYFILGTDALGSNKKLWV